MSEKQQECGKVVRTQAWKASRTKLWKSNKDANNKNTIGKMNK
jgi:hypothetical protein